MSCDGVTECVTNAHCVETAGSYTCECDSDYEGNGYKECTSAGLEEKYVYIIVFVILIVIGLVAILVFFLCRRKLRIPYGEVSHGLADDPYDMKWRHTLEGESFEPVAHHKHDEEKPGSSDGGIDNKAGDLSEGPATIHYVDGE